MCDQSARVLPRFDPVHLGDRLRRQRETQIQDNARKPFVTFLIGAGFSRSTGIPVASEIVKDLQDMLSDDPLFNAAAAEKRQNHVSEYAHFMAALLSPSDRARRIRGYVDRGRNERGQLRINWAHLLLAVMVRDGYINRILTTNFDPLVVEALALFGQPIRTFDLNTTRRYDPDILEPGAVIYLHGQMHSLLLANTDDETQRIHQHYRTVLQEALRDSYLVVAGYSGDCDPVLSALDELPTFPWGLWWSHYSQNAPDSPGPGVERIFCHHADHCRISTGDAADLFMRKLVLAGLRLSIPDEITSPFVALEHSLRRIHPPLPPLGSDFGTMPDSDPVASAIALVQGARKESKPAPSATAPTKAGPVSRPPGESPSHSLQDLQLKVLLDNAALAGDWATFDRIAPGIPVQPASLLSRSVGDGLVRRAGNELDANDIDAALRHLDQAQEHGVNEKFEPWIPILRGNARLARIPLGAGAPEVDRLFSEIVAFYAEALRLKPDLSTAYNNWGAALIKQARRKGRTPEAERLLVEAGLKLGEAVRLEPGQHAALYNWANGFIEQARFKTGTPEADPLLAEAVRRLTEAVRIKPDQYNAWFNLACVHALRNERPGCLEALVQWKRHNPAARRKKLDDDTDLDQVRDTPEFRAFRDTLPA
jgi:tetratricopeptide (TPR) repeat protein